MAPHSLGSWLWPHSSQNLVFQQMFVFLFLLLPLGLVFLSSTCLYFPPSLKHLLIFPCEVTVFRVCHCLQLFKMAVRLSFFGHWAGHHHFYVHHSLQNRNGFLSLWALHLGFELLQSSASAGINIHWAMQSRWQSRWKSPEVLSKQALPATPPPEGSFPAHSRSKWQMCYNTT